MNFFIKKPQHLSLIAIRHSTKHPIQSLLLILGVALGVAMIIAIDIANGSASEAFALSTDSIAGKATHQIVATPNDVPSELYEKLRVELGMRNIAPVVTGLVLLQDANDLPLQLLGVDPFAEAPFRNYLAAGENNLPLDIFTRLLIEPNTILIAEGLAERFGLASGDQVTLLANNQSKTVTLAAVLRPSDNLSRQALEGLLLSDISTAQELLGKTNHVSHIDLIINADSELDSILAILPDTVQLQRATLRNETLDQMTAAFELNLSALSLLGLTVGMFLIYNTISFSVVQRRPVLGSLRCLGVTRQEIFSLVLTEALVLSSIGTLLGLGLGILMGRGLVRLVSQTINDLFFTLTVQSVFIQPITLYKGVAAGLGAGLIAAFIPALEATRVPPISTLKRSVEETRINALLPVLSISGLVIILIGGALLILPSASVVISFGAMLLALLGIALLTPLLTKIIMRVLHPIMAKIAGVIGVMASRDITRSLSRTSVTIAALMISVAVIIGVSVMVSSFRSTIVSWLDSILQADIFVSPAGQSMRLESNINLDFIDAIETYPGITEIGLAREVDLYAVEYGLVELRAYNSYRAQNQRDFVWLDGTGEEAPTILRQGDIFISEVFAHRFEIPLNRHSEIALMTDDGPRTFTVKGIFYDYASTQGFIVMGLNTYQQYWDDKQISNVAIYLAPDVDITNIVGNLKSEFAGQYQLSIASNREIKKEALDIFERTFTITSALRLLATIVAFIGVLSALMSLQLERTREFGTLRANGMTIRQAWGLTLLETALIGLIAGLIAIPTGLMLAAILTYAINLRSFGWSLQLQFELQVFVMALSVALVAALLAGFYPSLRLSKMKIATALREE